MPKVNLRFNYWYKKQEAAAWSENKWYVWLHDCQMITWLSIGMSCEKILNELDTLNYPKGIKDFYGWFTPDNNAKGEAKIIHSDNVQKLEKSKYIHDYISINRHVSTENLTWYTYINQSRLRTLHTLYNTIKGESWFNNPFDKMPKVDNQWFVWNEF